MNDYKTYCIHQEIEMIINVIYIILSIIILYLGVKLKVYLEKRLDEW